MQRSIPAVRSLLLASAAVAVLAGCSSGNNNNNNSTTNTNSRVATAAATQAVTRTSTPATAARTTTPAVGAAARTSTPSSLGTAAAGARTATPSSTGTSSVGARTATPGAALGGTPATGAAGALAAPSDQALQQSLASAVVKPEDLPSGYSAQGPASTETALRGQTAGYTITYLNTSKLPQVTVVVPVLEGFADAATAGNELKDFENQIQSNSDANFTLQPVSDAPKLGDESQAFTVSGTSSGITLGGYAILWRRGNVDTAIVYLGAPAISNIDEAAGIAQKQDDKLKAAGR